MIGGSTTFGFPEHPRGEEAVGAPRHGFVGAMQSSLDGASPGEFELVNLGINGGGTTDSLRLMRKAVDWGASALVLYDGHNEFMGVPASFPAAAWRFALFRRFAVLAPRVDRAPGPVGPAAYGGDAQHDAIIGLFRSNLEAIVELAEDEGLAIVLSTQAANLAGFDPNWSLEGPSEGVRELSDEGLEEQWARYPRSAELAWETGVRSRGEAWDAYRAAADHDALPFRAPSAINEVLVDVAEKRGLVLVDAEEAVRTGDSVPGNELFYDWVHPRPEASNRLASAMLEGLVLAGLFHRVPAIVEPALSPEEAIDAELRTARAWLTWSCVRHHDPAWRLQRARISADAVLLLRPGDGEALGILAVAKALGGDALVRPEDPAVRERLSSLHRCIAELLH